MKHDYIFPQKIADFMGNISIRTQMEATMLSLVFILAGLVFFSVYICVTTDSLVFKIMWVINAFFGLILLGSYLITSYQQYKGYKEVMNLYKEEPKSETKEEGDTENIVKQFREQEDKVKIKEMLEKIEKVQEDIEWLKQ